MNTNDIGNQRAHTFSLEFHFEAVIGQNDIVNQQLHQPLLFTRKQFFPQQFKVIEGFNDIRLPYRFGFVLFKALVYFKLLGLRLPPPIIPIWSAGISKKLCNLASH